MKRGKVNRYTDLPEAMRPRERMIAAGSADELSDRELLMVMLKTGTAGCDVEETAKRLLWAFGTLGDFVRCSWQRLEERLAKWNAAHPDRRVLGVGRAKVLELAAAFELCKRGFRAAPGDITAKPIRRTEDAAAAFARALAVDEERERFRVLLLDSRRHPLCEPLPVSSGTIEGTLVHPREVFKEAVRRGAQSIIVSHNHPGGNPEPSDEDVALTRRLVAAGQTLGIPLLDHVVLANGAIEGIPPFASLRADRPELFS